ncbi:Hcp family type VI secretion system effector [Microbulbifer agarilyticus]|uniref:Hemolysin-coregulated protein n=1 Tax=Microbulbifer agarilyticus TaxID=260552 RepID=A0A1Q2M1D9_9GAMM|nr:type VI secretion system tube protein Hcp [Microbulbifer agarilyticus]AQQ66486.1 hemolysin-coregulated protein [Microbulbifer agarilyticus]MBY6190003.1 type VI secretion system tube protein Hcp [Microbulbifer agarilyticus]MBY6210005.1 type VI secretion system tube protein Hcp [Microbulbifer agarilyticus]MCA0894663.1 type VI secretion system tube protein Hcp [Microbulbifer agarilyticus]
MAIYMNFNNKTPAGNVTAKGYEDWIEVDSFNFGVGRGITMEAGAVANREATRPSLSEVTVTKRIDAASGGLFKTSVTGDEGVKVEIHVVQTGANSVEKFAVYSLEDVLISSYSIAASAGGAPMESISLSFAKIEADLNHADKTNKNPKNMRVGYDLTTATPL